MKPAVLFDVHRFFSTLTLLDRLIPNPTAPLFSMVFPLIVASLASVMARAVAAYA